MLLSSATMLRSAGADSMRTAFVNVPVYIAVIAAVTPAALAAASAPSARRPEPPARDPHAPGFVAASELPDGDVPPAHADGNFVVGPTRRSGPETSVGEGVRKGT